MSVAVCLALAAAQAGPAPGPVPPAGAAAEAVPCRSASTWRDDATDADRLRVRDWRGAWNDALTQAKASRRTIDAADPLFQPDAGLDRPLPPPGVYRCRFVKLGGAVALAVRASGRCRVSATGLTKLDGPQRPTGGLYPDTTVRGIFLGTLLLGDELRPLEHGQDTDRDTAGLVERIGPARWRVVLPRPRFESTLDLLELVPG